MEFVLDTLQTTVSTHDKSLRGRWNQLADRTSALLGESLLVLVARLGIAGFFFTAGRSKVEGFLTVSPATLELFRTDYALPFISPGLAAHMAAYAEHLFPLLLVVGLFSRLSALALLGMTAVIQVFLFPGDWPTHLVLAGLLLIIIARGAGTLSLDRRFNLR